MTKSQFSQALAVALSDADLSQVDDSRLYGCGLSDFVAPAYTTLDAVAKLIRYQCCGIFSGKLVDSVELDNLAHIARRKFQII